MNALKAQAAYLPGGHSSEAGHHLLVVPVPQELHPWTKARLDTTVRYIVASLREDTKRAGFAVVVDAQKCSWRLARAHIRYVQALLDSEDEKDGDPLLGQLIVIRPDAFWDTKHVVEHCAKAAKEVTIFFLMEEF